MNTLSKLAQALKGAFGIDTGIDTQPLFDKIAPRHLGSTVTNEGATTHTHKFVEVPWDSERLGHDFVDPDPDPGTPIAFPMATYRYLYRCTCGTEKIVDTRALI